MHQNNYFFTFSITKVEGYPTNIAVNGIIADQKYGFIIDANAIGSGIV